MSGLIRKIAIEVLFGEMIEFIVEKYSTGYWKVENEEKNYKCKLLPFERMEIISVQEAKQRCNCELPLSICQKCGNHHKAKALKLP